MEFDQKFFREIDLFDFTTFFGLDFFKIFWPTVKYWLLFTVIDRVLPRLIIFCLFSLEYAGLRCMEVIQENPCKIVHCKNGGVCQAVRSSDTKSYHSKCICPTNRAGLECERPNLCLNFCQNGGSCVSDHEGQVSCICPPGLGGSR